jgi:hypothetical protein
MIYHIFDANQRGGVNLCSCGKYLDPNHYQVFEKTNALGLVILQEKRECSWCGTSHIFDRTPPSDIRKAEGFKLLVDFLTTAPSNKSDEPQSTPNNLPPPKKQKVSSQSSHVDETISAVDKAMNESAEIKKFILENKPEKVLGLLAQKDQKERALCLLESIHSIYHRGDSFMCACVLLGDAANLPKPEDYTDPKKNDILGMLMNLKKKYTIKNRKTDRATPCMNGHSK